MDEPKQHLQQTLLEEIPIAGAMGITVEEYSGQRLTLRAPLENNFNHKSTAFGGSLYSVAVLAGWGLLFLRLWERGRHGQIVIQESGIQYLHPVAEDIVATCRLESETGFETFMRVLERRGRSRLELRCSVEANGATAVRFNGRYVVQA